MGTFRFFRWIGVAVIFVSGIFYAINFFYSFSEEIRIVNNIFLAFGLLFFALGKRNLTTWIFVCIILGVIVGGDYPSVAVSLRPLSQGFIKLVKTIVAPLLFASLVYGIAGHSDLKQVGRLAWKSLVYFYSATTIALIIGLIAINITKAGVGIDASKIPHQELPKISPTKTSDMESLERIPENFHWIYKTSAFFRDIFPENLVKSVYENQILQIVIFAIIFGVGLAQLPEKRKKPLVDFMDSLAETMYRFTHIIMYFAPIGVGAAMAYTVGHMGMGILKYLFMLLFTLYVALVAFVLLVLLPIALYNRVPIKNFLRAIKEPVSIAFATTSSDAALPIVMRNMEKFGVPRKIVSFVIPTGYSFNLDGTTLYLSLASIFVAQAAGMQLSVAQQFFIGLTLMITSKGVAAIPRASLIVLIATADQFGLPVFIIAAILGIDELMDMGRTTVNVIGNCLASVVVSKWENEFDEQKALSFREE
ncbi:MAG: cation:dicarboxylase symporter family transporter [Bergeyella sp.]|nr:cation:dicarboxylase symporter family transporter [Bergeyella sp.]